MVEFIAFPKIPRGQNETVTVTEKIDGTNAAVIIDGKGVVVGAQSRTRLITPDNDNFGFASWVEQHREELAALGPGHHYGEWAGPGIQKNHHNFDRRKFLLFNTARWNPGNPNKPECCDAVPVLYEGPYEEAVKATCMELLWDTAQLGGWHPEGIVLWYHRGRRYEKVTFENANGKWAK